MLADVADALVIAAHGRQYRVECLDGEILLCASRGKKSEAVCGDRVRVRHTAEGQGVIEHVMPRRTLLYRSNGFRQKRIAANVDQVILVTATEPAFSKNLLERCLIAATCQEISPCIVLNKCDLADRLPQARAMLTSLVALGYPCLELSARADATPLLPFLRGKTSVLTGQSGMGKSTLVNSLLPEARATTREISTALDSGKHATTHARLYRLDHNSCLIDAPGLQEFGLAHLSRAELEHAFPEFAPYLGQCRFRNCNHDRDPGCALEAAVASGAITPERLRLFQTLARESG
ncbi:MAG: ribosome small subunit-dependent GTPase A [Zoogloeaceae bacterium]|jgi:ribosome biogenesis GTPase|nr:ribosome small subunit-dependent GTPase A [Zoogloeaceae bacterium]